MQLKIDNEIQVTVIAGDTGETLFDSRQHNDISDDFLCGRGRIIVNNERDTTQPYCFLLPDGAAWTSAPWTTQGSVFDRFNPWAPFCVQSNDFDHTGATLDGLADLSYKTAATLFAPFGTASLRSPNTAGTNTVDKWRLFYRWTALPANLQLKAVALTAWQQGISDFVYGAASTPTIFIPTTLAVLGTSVLVRGRNGGAQTSDILEVSYFLSVVGA